LGFLFGEVQAVTNSHGHQRANAAAKTQRQHGDLAFLPPALGFLGGGHDSGIAGVRLQLAVLNTGVDFFGVDAVDIAAFDHVDVGSVGVGVHAPEDVQHRVAAPVVGQP